MIKTYKPTSAGRRFRKTLKADVSTTKPVKKLTSGKRSKGGRNKGRVSVRHKGSGVKKSYREIDFKRNKLDIPAKVSTIEYDPNRGANIALLTYADGEKSYILAPLGLKVGDKVISGNNVDPVLGNCLPLESIPLGMEIHNLEINPGAGGVMVRGAGNYAQITAKEGNHVNIRLPSGEVKKLQKSCKATIGIISNMEKRNVKFGKAGVKRHMGIRPTVRGVAMADPKHDHPHAGSYSTTGIGMPSPKTPWGKKARGVKTRKRKSTNYTIVTSRHDAKKRK